MLKKQREQEKWRTYNIGNLYLECIKTTDMCFDVIKIDA